MDEREQQRPEIIGICWDSEDHIWFEVDKIGELYPEDYSEMDHPHDVVYYRRVDV